MPNYTFDVTHANSRTILPNNVAKYLMKVKLEKELKFIQNCNSIHHYFHSKSKFTIFVNCTIQFIQFFYSKEK